MLSDEDTLDDILNDVNLDLNNTETIQDGEDDGDDFIPGTQAQLKQRLKAAIMYSVKQICEHEVCAAWLWRQVLLWIFNSETFLPPQEKELAVSLDKAFVPVLTELAMDV
jgi:hypothetical protein